MISNADIARELLREYLRRARASLPASALQGLRRWLAVWLATGAVLTAVRIASVGVLPGLSDIAMAVLSRNHLVLHLFMYAMSFFFCATWRMNKAFEKDREQLRQDELTRLRSYAEVCDRRYVVDGRWIKILEAENARVRKTALMLLENFVDEYDHNVSTARRAVDKVQVDDPSGDAALCRAKVLLKRYQGRLGEYKRVIEKCKGMHESSEDARAE